MTGRAVECPGVAGPAVAGPGGINRRERWELRPVWAEVDLDAIRHNASVLSAIAAPAWLCAVVKADGYGHGAVEAARAALDGGARWLAVALVEEGIQLREAGIGAPILVLSEPAPEAMQAVVEHGLAPTLYSRSGVREASEAAGRVGGDFTLGVHIKVDTGMRRVGATAQEAVTLGHLVAKDPALRLEGFCTHFAVADQTSDTFTDRQIDRFESAVEELRAGGVAPTVLHAANSAGTLWHRRARYSMVRCGIALYGLSPTSSETDLPGLEPALSLKAKVSYVKTVSAGEGISYGLRYRVREDSTIATVPIGYADGVPRAVSGQGAHVLIGAKRYPIAGTVTMDQLLVDCGRDGRVSVGDEVVLIGRQGDQTIRAEEVARLSGTICYEVVCAISARVPRRYAGVQSAKVTPR